MKQIQRNPKSSQYINEDGSRTRFGPRPNSKIDSILEKRKAEYRKENGYVKDIDNSQIRVHKTVKQTKNMPTDNKKSIDNKYEKGVTYKEYMKLKSKKK